MAVTMSDGRSSRREFLMAAALAGAAAGIGHLGMAPFARGQAGGGEAPKKLRILILGGTGFLGPALVEASMARGHTLTLFNRGRTNPHLFPDVEKLEGNRDGDLKALEGRQWDAVVDTSGYVPRIVRDSATLLKDAVKQYVFISTLSVYADYSTPGRDENSPLATMDDPTSEEVRQHYGALKALSEQAAEEVMPGRVTNIRPGLIVGPRDPSDRFTYWPVRVGRGGEVMCPGSPDDLVQIIDVRDLAEWTVHTMEKNIVGVFNAVGPWGKAGTLTIGGLIDACVKATKSDAKLTWVETEFLQEHNVQPWSDMPVWVPPVGDYAGFGRTNVDRAMAAGLTFRPIADTVKATLEWWETLPEERRATLKAGIRPEREAEVLKAWHERAAAGQ